MPLLQFEVCRQRIERARFHSEAFAKIWNELLEDEVYSTYLQINPDGTGFISVMPRYEPLPEILSIEMGEILYQLRSALDACVYVAAILDSGQDPPPRERDLEFPICVSAADFKKAGRKIEPLAKKRRRIIEAVQPYNTPKLSPELYISNFNRTFQILHDWARKDRHRKLHVIGTWASKADPQLNLPAGVSLDYLKAVKDGFLEGESKIATFKLNGYAVGAKVEGNPNILLDVAVNEPPIPCADNDTLSNRVRAMILATEYIVNIVEGSF